MPGAPISKLEDLINAHTVTISQLMEIAPPGTIDPTPHLYDTTMLAMASLLGIAVLCNLAIRPVHKRHFQVSAAKQGKNLKEQIKN